MSAEIAAIVRDLSSALAVTNAALEEEASERTRRGAVRSLHRALRRTAEADDLWADLMLRATTGGSVTAPSHELLGTIADLLVEQQVALLVSIGYRSPPPPRASALINDTRARIEEPPAGESYAGVAHLDAVRVELQKFVERLARNAPRSDSRVFPRLLAQGRRVGVSTCVLLVASSVQVKTGDALGFDVGASIRDGVGVEVTVPAPWQPEDAGAALIGAASSDLDLALTEATPSDEERAMDEREVLRSMVDHARPPRTSRTSYPPSDGEQPGRAVRRLQSPPPGDRPGGVRSD
ncbi:hypothetical protein [Geodermatophilus saharensis]|nr:hypothetical protein [Geodermatophilus saharensis]